MNILDKQSPGHQTTPSSNSTNSNNPNNNSTGSNNSNGGNGPPPPPSTPGAGSLTPNSDCGGGLIPNSQLIPSLSAPGPHPPASTTPGCGGGPSSVSSSSAPHTPLDGLNVSSANCPTDPMSSNGLVGRPNTVSTPSSAVSFNNSAPNTPMPCPSVSSTSDAPITSPALNQLTGGSDSYGGSGPTPTSVSATLSSQSPFANNQQTNSANNTSSNLLSSPLSVHHNPQQSCNQENIKNKPSISNGGNNSNNNKKHCNNRSNQNNVNHQPAPPPPPNNTGQNNYVPSMNPMNQNNCSGGMPCGGPNTPGDNKGQMSFSMNPQHQNTNQMPCSMQNGMVPLNGNISPFDLDNKMNFPNEFSPDQGCPPPPMPNSCLPPPRMSTPCPIGMNMPPMPNQMMNIGPNKMCNMNMIPNAPPPPQPSMKTSPMDGQFMQQHQNQVFVFSTSMANHAAEAVDQGHFPSIIHFHMNHPQTKKFIDKNSIKLQNFNRPNNVWMSNIRPPRIRGPNSNGMSLRGNFSNPCFTYNHNPPGPGPGGGPSSPGPGQWNPNWPGNNHMPGGGGFPPNDMKMNCGNPGMRPCTPSFNSQFNQTYHLGCSDTIQDDNLTPQQKQHRENKLAILANLQQKFLQQDLIEPNNRLPPPPNSQSQPNDFGPMDPMTPTSSNQSIYVPPDQMAIKSESDQMNQPPPSMNPSEMSFNPNFCPNPMMNNHPQNEQWLKSPTPNFPLEEPTKPFTTNGRRKGSQNTNHQSPISQTSVNSPNSCINQSPGNRVPPPPYNQGLRAISSPHPTSPALPSPRMPATSDSRQPNYTPASVRSGPSTPSADSAGCAGPSLINSPKSSSQSRTTSTNSSPGNKKNKQQSSIDNDLNMFAKSEHSLMPVPSPQQIDYISQFEGQELTIQKQPNAHFQEGNDLIGNNDLSGLNNDIFPNEFGNMCPPPQVNNPMSMDMNPNNNPRFPTSQPCNFDSRYSDNMRFNGNNGAMDGYRPPHMCAGDRSQFSQNDPNMRFPNCDMKPRMSTPNDIGPPFPPSNSMCDMNFSSSIPPITDGSFPNGPGHNFNDPSENPISSTHLQNLQKMAPPFDMPPNSKPMRPNNSQMMGPNSKNPRLQGNYEQPFGPGPMGNMPPCSDMNDSNYSGPQSHMAQSNMPMNYPNNFSGSPQMPSNIIPPTGSNDPNYGGMHSGSFSPMPQMNPPPHPMVDQNVPSNNGPSPMPMMPPGGGGPGSQGNFPPRLLQNMNRPMNAPNTHGPRYNSPNIQVKPDAPNTIQYLPSRPQGPTTTPPNRPPNLDFLQQSLNMGSNKSSGPPPPPNTYYPPNNSSMPPNRPQMNFTRGPMMRPPPQNMNSGQAPPPGNMCQGNDMFSRPPTNHQMTNGPNQMLPPPPNTNFGNGPPTGPGNGPIPPPSSNKPGGNAGPVLHPDSFGNFNKSSLNSLPSPNDPSYAAQFHNFQQQLYATNTRNSNNPRMTSNF